MDSLFWPGVHRAHDCFSNTAFRAAMVAVEAAWVGQLLHVPTGDLDVEAGGNGVIPLVAVLRRMHPELDVHTGLTSQDVVDTALMLMLRDAAGATRDRLEAALGALRSLDDRYGSTSMIGRTLTQWALPITFAHKLSVWRTELADAIADLDALRFPAQVGGPVGGLADQRDLAEALGLSKAESWHTHRRPITRIGDALVGVTDACGHIARDVLALSRPEVGELSEGSAGGSSSMPHKANPVLSVLVRRAALAAPPLGATLHLCAAEQVDERADGAWHAEWDTLRLLARRTLIAADQTAELLRDLQVHPDRMRANLASAQAAIGGDR